MTPQDLKNAVLQRAIQGKLVPQDPKEGSGEELLSQIREEKTRLLKEGKIKKEKPLPDITEDEKPFEIPDNWVWVRWGDLSESIQYGYNTPASSNGNVRMLRISDIQDNRVIWENVPFCSIKEDDVDSYLLSKNDILFARTGGTVGKSYLVQEVPYKSIYAGYLIRTRYGKFLCPQYLKSFMESELYWTQLRNGTIATAQPNCNGKTLANMLLPLPPLSEQKRIVSKLESLQPFIESYARAWTRLEELSSRFPSELRKSLLQRAIEGRLVPRDPSEGTGADLLREIQQEKKRLLEEGKIKKEKPLPEIDDDEKPFEIPGHWTWVRLGGICLDLNYGTSRKSVKTGKVVVLRMGNIQNGKIDYSNLVFSEDEDDNQKYLLKPNDLLFNRTNSRELVGKTGIYRGEKTAIYAGYLVRIRTILVDPEYLNFVMNSEYEHKYCQREKSDGINQSNVNASKIAKMLVPLPPLSEQKRIVQKLEELLPLCDRLTSARRRFSPPDRNRQVEPSRRSNGD